MFCLVCFDIVDDRTRARAGKVLKEYGERVQKSVFECPLLDEQRFLRMKDKIESCIDHTEDTVRYYFICRGCIGKMEYSGIGDPPDLEDYRIV